MNALLPTTMHSPWLGKYSCALRTRSRVLQSRASWHACGSTRGGVSSPSLRAFMNNPGQALSAAKTSKEHFA